MDREVFLRQMDRIMKNWGDKNYQQERLAIFWKCLKDTFDTDFELAIDNLIANHRSPPMLEDLSRAVENAKVQRNTLGVRNQFGIPQILQRASDSGKSSADPEFVKACLKVLRDKLHGQLNSSQFLEGCDYLDQTAKALK